MNFDKAKEKYLDIKAPTDLYEKTLSRINDEKAEKPRFTVIRFASLAAACLCVVAAITLVLTNNPSAVKLTDDVTQIETLDFVPSATAAAYGMRSMSIGEGALLPITFDGDCKIEFESGRFASKVGNHPPAEIASGTTVPKESLLYVISVDEGEYTVTLTTEKDELLLRVSVENTGKIRLSLKKT